MDDKDSLTLDWTVEDLDIEMIHSRKVRIRAVLTFTITADGLVQEGLVTAASANEPLETREENYQITRIAVQKRETYRVSEELEISGNKPNLGELIWREVELRGADCRPLDGALAVRGELAVFCHVSRRRRTHAGPVGRVFCSVFRPDGSAGPARRK